MNIEEIKNKVEEKAGKPYVTARFGDNWKNHARENYTPDSILDIAWKNGRKCELYEMEIEKMLRNKPREN